MKRACGILIAAGLSLGCLVEENRHAFYLEPGGATTWSVTEEDIRPVDDARPERHEDRAVAVAFRSLGASWIDTRVVRDIPPYTIVTEARFESAATMLATFLTRIGFEAEADLHFDGRSTRLSFRFSEPEEPLDGSEGENDPAAYLLASVEAYRFVLTRGEFVETSGFRLNGDRTRAEMRDPDEVETETDAPGAFYSLTWETR